ncbi:ATP-grasp domain-containing protein [Clostridium pasteurianum]|uniref:Biotin carboxylase n=1 Tax=Clostridium pasteurianum BC1 TaxID=86416 RepID=R4K752_CLOPA|nr:ATP-grasp domain-containing protein [Clostridium pasteurianum]AGK97501.1 biotin carboxylase [Clostridium pasteurianum BC1]
MKTIVFIGTLKSGSSREAIKVAEQLGYYTVLLTGRLDFLDNRTDFHDVHLMRKCNLNKMSELRDAINNLISYGLDIKVIVSFLDARCYTAALLAEEFGLGAFSSQVMSKMKNKIISRGLISGTEYCPNYLTLSGDNALSEEELKKKLPIIIKSPKSTGSKDVYKVTSYEEFIKYYNIFKSKYPNRSILIEEFLDGPQYLIETVVKENHVNIAAIIEQEITFTNNHFIVTGYNMLIAPPKKFYDSLKKAVSDIIKIHGMKKGSCHLEMRYIKGKWKLVEINPRISGANLNKMIEISFGINLVGEILKIALGEVPDVKPKFKKYTFAKYVISPQSGILEEVTGTEDASKCSGVEFIEVLPKKGAFLKPPVTMGNRYACVIATGDTEEEAKAYANLAASKINFKLTSKPNNVIEKVESDK